jgi:hypothetical protein
MAAGVRRGVVPIDFAVAERLNGEATVPDFGWRAMVKSVPGSAARAVLLACTVLVLVVPGAHANRPPGAQISPATDIGADAATLNGLVNPFGHEAQYFFRYGIAGYDAQTPVATAGGGIEPVAVSARVVDLTPDTVYRVQLVALSPHHTMRSFSVTFRTLVPAPPAVAASPPAPVLSPVSPDAPGVVFAPPPVFGERVNVAVRTGTVTVQAPGGRFVPLEEFASVPVGSLLNTREGSVNLTSALPGGGTQTGLFHGGTFEARQPKTAGGRTTLVLRGRGPVCRRAGASAVAVTARRRKRRRALWGNVLHGNFRTRGGNSVATVRGTIWYVEDRCNGTLTRVKRGSVSVRDLRRHRTVVVRAGQSYLARAKR